MKRPIIATALTAGIIGVTAFAGAGSAEAGRYTAAQLNNFTNSAWYNAKAAGGSLAPMTNTSIQTKGDTWCYTLGRDGSTSAYRNLAAQVGTLKANAIGKAADNWFC